MRTGADHIRLLAEILSPARDATCVLGLCGEGISHGLFTAMRFHVDAMKVERIHSSLPAVYPVSGRKPKRDTEWGRKVLVERPNVGMGPADIAWAISDHETILGLGLRAVLNVPVLDGEWVAGTINWLRRGPAFDPDEIRLGQLLAAASPRGATTAAVAARVAANATVAS